MKAQLHAKNVGATGSKLKEVHEQELGRCISEIAILIDRLKDVTVTKTSALYVPDKVDLLENTSKTIQESKKNMAVLAKCTPGLPTGSVATKTCRRRECRLASYVAAARSQRRRNQCSVFQNLRKIKVS